ncbi:MAG TPA: hypothetical protein PLN21_09180 [Gemmatales bacterium]|nr:hypothetical protein [Gemmatales bacterium]
MSSFRWVAAGLAIAFGVSSVSAQTVYSDNFQYGTPNGPIPFTSTYTQVNNGLVNGMSPAGVFSVTSDLARDLGAGQTQHPAIGAAPPGHNFFDHTFNNSEGLYLAVNGNTATSIYTSNSFAVQPNTDYVFSVWLNSWTYAGLPTFGRLDVRLTGDVSGLGSIGFADAPMTTSDYNSWGAANLWTQVAISFNSGNNTSLTLDLFNVNTEVDGNDYSVDDISITAAVPEPGVIALGSIGAAGFGAAIYSKIRARRRRKMLAQQKKMEAAKA